MATSFKDHFSSVAAGYAAHRPGYPPELFAGLSHLAPGRRRAWDCGCGTGQASRGLARHFREVVASDASPEQIAAAPPHPGVTFRVAPAHASGLPEESVDLVLVAQALHWFPLDDFHREVRRVARPGAVLAALTYNLLRISATVDAVVDELYFEALSGHWPPERRHVDRAYADLPFPFEPLPPPRVAMEAAWTVDQLIGYLGTWSALARCRSAGLVDPLQERLGMLREAWGSPERRPVRWPLTVLVGRIDLRPGSGLQPGHEQA